MCDLETSRMGPPYIYIYDISSLRVKNDTISWLFYLCGKIFFVFTEVHFVIRDFLMHVGKSNKM